MIRFILRFSGLCIFAAGFVALVIDGSRSIAGSAFLPTALAGVLETLVPDSVEKISLFFQSFGLGGSVRDAVMWVLGCPASVVLIVAGLVFLWVGRKPRPLLGLKQT